MEAQMPYRKILFAVLISFMKDTVIWLNTGVVILVNMNVQEGLKLYALIIGAIYTTYKLYKDVLREFRWWQAFSQWQASKWNAGYYLMVKAILDVKRQLKKKKE